MEEYRECQRRCDVDLWRFKCKEIEEATAFEFSSGSFFEESTFVTSEWSLPHYKLGRVASAGTVIPNKTFGGREPRGLRSSLWEANWR